MQSYNFNQFAEEGNRFINELAIRLGDRENKTKAVRILKSVMHALRNRISAEESVQFLSQLPMMLKALYVDGWRPGKKYIRIKHVDDFLDEVKQENLNLFTNDFQSKAEVKEAASIVFNMLGEYVSTGEINDIRAVLPEEIGDYFLKAFTY